MASPRVAAMRRTSSREAALWSSSTTAIGRPLAMPFENIHSNSSSDAAGNHSSSARSQGSRRRYCSSRTSTARRPGVAGIAIEFALPQR